MSNETLKAIVNLFVVSTPGQSNAARRTQFAELLEQMAPTPVAQPVTPQPSTVTQAPPVGVATWPYGSARPVQPGPSAKPNLAQALGLKPIAQPTDSRRNRVVRVISQQLGFFENEVKDNKHIIADLGADSLDIIELVMAIEDEFGIEIPEEHAEACSTVGDVIRYVQHRIPAPKTPAPAAHVSTVSENGRLYVNIRKHPQGHPQPIGKRKVVRLDVRGDVICVGIGDGRLGWTFNLKDPAPSFLDFIVNGEKGQKVSLPEAIAYWKRHNS